MMARGLNGADRRWNYQWSDVPIGGFVTDSFSGWSINTVELPACEWRELPPTY